MRLVLSIIISFSSIFTTAEYHPLHVSVCEIKHNTESDWLEVTVRLFADDFQDVLENRTGIKTNLGTENEYKKTDDFIYDYLQEKIQIIVNGEYKVLQFIGKEIDLDDLSTYCYLYIPNIKEINTIEIANSVMVHWFNDQVNVTHVDCNDKLKSTFFSAERVKEKFTY